MHATPASRGLHEFLNLCQSISHSIMDFVSL